MSLKIQRSWGFGVQTVEDYGGAFWSADEGLDARFVEADRTVLNVKQDYPSN